MKALAQKRRGIRVSARKEVLEQNRLRNGFERKLRKQLSTAFTRIGRAAQREFVAHGRLLQSIRGIEDTLYNLMESHYRAVINEFGLRIIRDRKEDTQFEFLVREYLRVNGGTRITQISETTRKQIMSVISVADEDGLGVQVTGKRIFDSMNGSFSRYRAATIARTETHSAASFANDQVNRSLNIPNQLKRWVSVADARTRATHVQANGTEIPLDEDFIIGGVPMKYTGDPKGGPKNVINCRCVTLYITPEDEVVDDVDTPLVKPVKAGKLEIGTLITNKVSDRMRKRFDDKINDNLSPLALSAALNLPLPDSLKNSKKGYYQRGLISSDLDSNTLEHEYGHHVDYKARPSKDSDKFLSERDQDFQQAFIDDATALGIGKEGIDFGGYRGYQIVANDSKLEELRDRIAERVEKTKTYTRGRRKGMSFSYHAWEPKYVGLNSISDIVDAMTKGDFFTKFHQWGHGRRYYRRNGSHYYETFANLYAIHGNAKAWAEAKELFPNLCREFERMLKEIAE